MLFMWREMMAETGCKRSASMGTGRTRNSPAKTDRMNGFSMDEMLEFIETNDSPFGKDVFTDTCRCIPHMIFNRLALCVAFSRRPLPPFEDRAYPSPRLGDAVSTRFVLREVFLDHPDEREPGGSGSSLCR